MKLQEGLLTALFQADPIIFHSPPRRQRGPGSQAWGGQGRPPTCRGRQRGSAHDTRPEQETDTCDGDQDHGGRWTLPILPWCCDTVANSQGRDTWRLTNIYSSSTIGNNRLLCGHTGDTGDTLECCYETSRPGEPQCRDCVDLGRQPG